MSDGNSHVKLVIPTEEFHHSVWKHPNGIVVTSESLLTDNCVICHREAHGNSIRKRLFWHPPILLPLVLLSFPFYLLLAIFMRKTLVVDLPICSRHLLLRRATTCVGLILLPGALLLGSLALSLSEPIWILAGIGSSISGIALLGWARNPVWATEIKGQTALIRGVHPNHRVDLPSWQGNDLS